VRLLNDILYLTVDELVAYGISERTISQGVWRGQKNLHHDMVNNHIAWKSISDPRDRRRCLVDYDSIPPRSRALLPDKSWLLEQYKLAHSLAARQQAQQQYAGLQGQVHHALESGYIDYMPDYWDALQGPYPKHMATQLARAAATLQVGVELSYRRGWTTQLPHYAELVGEARLKYLNSGSPAYLRQKIKAAIQAGERGVVAVIQPKNLGNTARLKYSIWHQHMAEVLYAQPRQYTYAQIHGMLNARAAQLGMEAVGWEWLKHYLARPEVQNRNLLPRMGKAHYRNVLRPHTKRLEAVYAGDCWVMDGTRSAFAYRKAGGATGYLDLFVVLDAHSLMVVGWAAHDNEDALLVEAAIRRAIKATGHLPYEVLSDNSSAVKSELVRTLFDGFTRMGGQFRQRFAKVGNARDKVVERWFSTFDNTVCRAFGNWTGEGIKSKRDNARQAPEAYEAVKPHLPTRQEMLAELAYAIELYNTQIPHESRKGAALGLSPAQRYAQSEKPHVTAVDTLLAAHLLWSRRTATVRSSMVKLTLRHVEHFFRIRDVEAVDALNGTQVEVRYDADDLTEVAIFQRPPSGSSASGGERAQFICMAQAAKRVQGYAATQTEEDLRQAAADAAQADKMERLREQLRQERDALAAQLAPTDTPLELFHPATGMKRSLNTAESALVTRLALQEEGVTLDDYHHSALAQHHPADVAEKIIADTVKPLKDTPRKRRYIV
jgi:transposase InsO family protein